MLTQPVELRLLQDSELPEGYTYKRFMEELLASFTPVGRDNYHDFSTDQKRKAAESFAKKLVTADLRRRFGDIYELYSACLEIPVSEEAFRTGLMHRNDIFSAVPEGQRQPYIDLSRTSAFKRIDVKDSFFREDYDKLIGDICDEMIKHVTDPDIGTKLINTSINSTAFSAICTQIAPDIPATESLAILPTQRALKYVLLLKAVLKEAEAPSLKKGRKNYVSDSGQ